MTTDVSREADAGALLIRSPAASGGAGGMLARIRRHDFAYLGARTSAFSLAGPHDATTHSIVSMWIDTRRPFVVRQQAGTCDDRAALGLPLTRGNGKRRIALTVERSCIARVAAPPALDDVIDALSPLWRTTLALLDRRARSIGIRFRVFGSVAWQALTGLPYVTGWSDIDLLWQPRCRPELNRGLALLADWERGSGIRTDCEITFPGGDAVAWREWIRRSAHARILVKRLDGTTMRTPAELLCTLDAEGTHALAAG
jgi:phosphoribosyl-dephospho-CoA transferase